MTVKRIAVWYRLGHEPEEIVREIGHISLAQVHAALAYYHLHQDDIERDIEEDERAYDEAERAERGA